MGEKSMKYAFIALIALYLIIYGCSPDNSEKATDSHENTAPATMEHPPQGESVAIPKDQHDPADAAEQTTGVEEAAEQAPQAPQGTEQQPAEVADSQQVVMPCGRTMDLADVPVNAPCLNQQSQEVDDPQDLAAALQRMVDTTNDMVLVTRQLSIATQEMLNASKGVAEEVIDMGNEIMEAEKEKQPVEQSIESREPAATPERDIIKTMQDVVSAAEEVVKSTNEALSTIPTSFEAKQQQ
jgi:hypothetical protein